MARANTLFLTAILSVLSGCGTTSTPARTGFLSDYSQLKEVSPTSFRFVAPTETARQYSSFIIDPVKTVAYEEKAGDPAIGELAEYFRTRLTETLAPDFPVVARPGQNVARIRVAITDVKASAWYLNLHPASKLTGAGLGEASMELEIVDSVSGAQIAALVETQRGSRLELDAFSKHDDAKDAINDWCTRFRARLDEIHGKASK